MEKKEIKLNYTTDKIKDYEKKGCKWEKEDTRKIALESANEYFNDEIRKRNRKKESKLWHKSV